MSTTPTNPTEEVTTMDTQPCVTHLEAEGPEGYGGTGTFRLVCSTHGHWATYRGRSFSRVEAGRHDDYFARKAAQR